MRKVFSTILILLLLLSLSLISAITVMADGTTWYVNASYTGAEEGTETNPYNTIQEAIDAASAGDTVNVAAGEYTEQVLIRKDISLIGAGEGVTTIKAPAARTGTVVQGDTWDYIVAAYPSSGTINVKIEGFTIDADAQPKQTGTAGLVGVFFRNVQGDESGLFDSTIQGFEQVEYQSWGVRVYGDSELAVEGNTLTGYTRDGITVNGDGGEGADPSVIISNNDLTGNALPLNGISLSDGATGTIDTNTVRNHTRSADWAACGILVKNSDGVYVTDNTVLNTFYAIYIGDADNCTVSGNILTDYIKRAISLDTANNNTISGNTINGPAAGTDDVGIGLANNSSNNTIGGDTAPAGNTITMATPSVPDGIPLMYAIHLDGTAGSGNTIKFNTITGGKRAVQIDGPPGITGTTTISNNTISGQAFGGIVANNNGNLIIENNTLTDTVRPIELWGPVDVTITGNSINGADFDAINMGNVSGTKLISDNIISNIPLNCFAIHGQPDADNLVIDGNTISASHAGIWIDSGCTGVTITDNIIFDNTYSGISAYDALTTVTGNSITNCWRGIETNSDLTAHNNAFVNNTYGAVIFYDAGARDLTNNWWGSSSGPEVRFNSININTYNQGLQGNYIQSNDFAGFVFSPWLNASPPTGVSFYPVINGANGYASIQAAVDAATAGDTVNVVAGTYNENITINNPVNLTGIADESSILPTIQGTLTVNHNGITQATTTNIENINFLAAATGNSIVLDKANNVNIKDCRFDADGRWMTAPGIVAVQINSPSSDITIDTCIFENGYYVTIQGCVDNLTVTDSIIRNVKSGINLQSGSNLAVTDTDISVIAQGVTNDTYCVRFASESADSGNGMTITGGIFTVDKNSLVAASGIYHIQINGFR